MSENVNPVIGFVAYALGGAFVAAVVTFIFQLIMEGSVEGAIKHWPFLTWYEAISYTIIAAASVAIGERIGKRRRQRKG